MIKLLTKNKERADVSTADSPTEWESPGAASTERAAANGGHDVEVRGLHAY